MKINPSTLYIAATLILLSCSKESSKSLKTEPEKRLSINKEAFTRSEPISVKERNQRDLFIESRLQNIQENLGITNSNIVALEVPVCNSISDDASLKYEVIPVKSEEQIRGFL